MNRRILFVESDPAELERLQELLHDKPEDWEVIFVRGGNDALVELANQPCELVCAAMDTADMPGTELLQEVRRCYPKTSRFLLVNTGGELANQTADDLHHLLIRPLDEFVLRAALNAALSLDVWLTNDRIKSFVTGVRAAGSLPSFYAGLLRRSSSPAYPAEPLGAVFGHDSVMSKTFLDTVNSASFAPTVPVTNLAEAVAVLGMPTVVSIVLGIRTWHELDQREPDSFSTKHWWGHQVAVASLAKHLAQVVTKNETLANEAFAAGMLHDVGKLLLASHLGDAYRGAQSLAAKSGLPLVEVEEEIFGVTHAETGAYFLGFLGLPFSVLEAIALHHAPARSPNRKFSALSAVHVANAFVHQREPASEGLSAQPVDLAYLESLGLAGQLKAWPKMPLTSSSGQPVQDVQRSVALQPARNSPPPITPASKWTPPRKTNTARWSPRFFVPAACLVLVAAGLLLVRWYSSSKTSHVSARESLTPTAAVPAPPVTPARAPSVAPSEGPGGLEAPVAPAVLPKEDLPKLKLQGIYYFKDNPAAVIDGRTLYRGQKLKGGRIVAIGPQSVTLDFDGQRLTLTLKKD